jgi:hypothetical protein
MQSAKRNILFFLVILVLGATIGCTTRVEPPKYVPNITKFRKDIPILRFEQDLFALDTNNFEVAIQQFEKKYDGFVQGYYTQVLNISPIHPRKIDYLKNYMTYTGVLAVQDSLKKYPINFTQVQKELNDLGAFYSYYFSKDTLGIQKAITYYSDYSSDRAVGNGFVAFPLDMTLGEGFQPYSYVKIPKYMQRTLTWEHLVSKAALAIATIYVEDSVVNKSGNMINRMFYEAKKYYLADLLLPTAADSLKFGFSSHQMDVCKNNEAELYNHLVEAELFYSTKEADYARYINPGPFNPSLNMPGNSGSWLGYRILLSYANQQRTELQKVLKNPREIDRKVLAIVMKENNPQKLLSFYKPLK